MNTMQSQPMVYLITYGCKVNYYETEAVASLLDTAGVPNQMIADGSISKVTDASIFVVNSCAVTSMAEKKTRYGLSKIRKYHPHARIVTMGCALGRKTPEAVANEICHITASSNVIVQHRREKAFIKVQDGCQNFCSYCIIPYLRQKIICRPIAEVVAEINAQGPHVTDVILCGINLCYYPDFAELCRAVDGCGRRWWISSLEPPMMTPNLIDVLAQCKNFVPNFHICLQSGCDQVLRDMNRHYTAADYRTIIENLRVKFPHGIFATDVIVGYPTETDAAFQTTYQFLRDLHLDKLHIFPFSARNGTPAAKLKPITNQIVTERFNLLNQMAKH